MVKIRLREIAEAKGLNISKVQIGAGVSMGSVRRYWYNETNIVYLDVLEALCRFLDVAPGDLLVITESDGDESDTPR